MRINLPVTGRVVELRADAVLSSTTDTKGRILAVNDDFVTYSGFSRDELIGKAHNIVRHPDMPEAVFADMWRQLKAGRCWRGLVKNRCKNGDTYWVDANVSPSVEGETVVGYVSVRRRIDPSVELSAVEREYSRVKQGELAVHGGHLMSHWARRRASFWDGLVWRPNLGEKFLLAGLPVLLLLLLAVALVANTQWKAVHSASFAIENVETWRELAPLIQAMQNERSRSVAFIGVRDSAARDDLSRARRETDKICASVECRSIPSLQAARVATDEGSTDLRRVLDGYTTVIDDVVNEMGEALHGLEAKEDFANATQVLELIQMSEALGVERAAIQASLTGNLHDDLLTPAVSQRQAAERRTLRTLSPEWSERLQRAMTEGAHSTRVFRERSGHDDAASASISESAFSAYSFWIDQVFGLLRDHLQSWRTAAENRRQSSMSELGLLSLAAMVALALTGTLSWSLVSNLKGGLAKVGAVLRRVATNGDFHARVDLPDTQDELGALCKLTDLSLNQVERSMVAVTDVMAGIASGDMSRRVSDALTGDLAVLKERINAAADTLADMTCELTGVMQGLAMGRLDVRLSDKVHGDLRPQVNDTLAGLEASLNGLGQLLGDLAGGRFGREVKQRGKGAFAKLEADADHASRSLEQTVRRISDAVAALADGRLNAEIDTPLQGEFEDVRIDFNLAIGSLSGLVGQIQILAQLVASESVRMSEGSEQLNLRSQQQAASLEETAAAIEQLASSVATSSHQAANARNQASTVQELSRACAASMAELKQAMSRSLASSDAIAGAVELIESIAFQTNLLALNAAVEAARAGEQGRGFAVVASEVRGLASRATQGVTAIRRLIETARSDTRQGAEQVDSAAADLESVGRSLERLDRAVSEIAGAAREQSSGIDQINQAALELDALTQRNAALAESSAAGAQGIQRQATHLSELLASLQVSATPLGASSVEAA